jgi:hypothetical protein
MLAGINLAVSGIIETEPSGRSKDELCVLAPEVVTLNHVA